MIISCYMMMMLLVYMELSCSISHSMSISRPIAIIINEKVPRLPVSYPHPSTVVEMISLLSKDVMP